MLVQIRLVEGQRQMLIRPRDGIADTDLDFGFPEIRAQVDSKADGDGTTDTTQSFGASSVALSLDLYRWGTTRGLLDELRSYCHPGLRPYLYVSDDEWVTERRIQLRADQMSAPISKGTGYRRTVQVQWKAPAGHWEAANETVIIVPADLVSSAGSPYPRTYPYHYVTSTETGMQMVANIGIIPSHHLTRLYGPCTGPKLVHSSGDVIAFTDSLVLGAGEYVEIDSDQRSAYLMSDPSLSMLNYVDYVQTDWFPLDAGDQTIQYAPSNASAGSVAEIHFRPGWF